MPLILPANTLDSAYEIDNSCMFVSGDSHYMHKTPSSQGSLRKLTLSVWVKKCQAPQETTWQWLLHTGDSSDGDPSFGIGFKSDALGIIDLDSSYNLKLYSTRLLRDPNAWYHICVAIDTDQSTEADRVKAWINNERITEWATSDHPSQNLDLDGGINKTSYAMEVGRDNYGGGEAYFEGYMADYVYIDGTQYDPTYFGEYDSDSPQIWKPKKIAGLTFGTNGFYLDFADSSNLGNDKNGGTDLTEVNIAAADQCDDTPTNNFATLNPLQASLPTGSVHQGMFDGNLGSWTSSADNSADYRQWSSIAIPHTGKWYVETKWTRNSGTHTKARMGILAFHDDVTHGVVLDGDFDKIVNGSSSSYATGSVAYGEIFGSLYDLANNQVTFYEAGSSLGTISWTPNADYTYFHCVFADSMSLQYTVNFGNPSPDFVISSGNADPNGYGEFEYGTNSGYALCTKNLNEFG